MTNRAFGHPCPWPFTPPVGPQWESSTDRNLAHRLDHIERELGLIRKLLQAQKATGASDDDLATVAEILRRLSDDSNPEVTHDE